MPRVLMVEDNPFNRKLMRDILEIRFEVMVAGNAEEAIPLLEQHSFDLVLMDLQLPGMDGLELIRQMKSTPATQSVPVIAVSAHAMQQNIDEAMSLGCVDYVTKPILEDPFELVERFRRFTTPDTSSEE